jgi:hypothetical protein
MDTKTKLSIRYLLIIAGIVFAVALEAQTPSPSEKADVKQSLKLTAADQQGTEKSPLVVKVLPAPKTDKEVAAEANDRAEKITNDRKLVEFNRNLVRGTWALVAIGFLQLLVFGIQAHQLWKTVMTGTEQSKDMKDSIAAANRSAVAMEITAKNLEISTKAALESVDAIKKQMRAYITVNTGGAIFQDRTKDLRFEGKPTLVNDGHTPAHNVCYRAKAAILSVPLPADFAFPLPDKPNVGALVGPHQTVTMNAIVDDFCEDKDIEKIKRGVGIGLFMWGIITYEDAFGQPHETKFCHNITWLPNDSIWGYFIPGQNIAT